MCCACLFLKCNSVVSFWLVRVAVFGVNLGSYLRLLSITSSVVVSGNNCYYDNSKGYYYMGRKNNGSLHTCVDWTKQSYRPGSAFVDGSLVAAKNYCRNPDSGDRPWCFYHNLSFFYCDVNACGMYSNIAHFFIDQSNIICINTKTP